ncbi:MAG: efflux RND transporter periplasmic adaptor subunit [Phycisphaerales bacterium JB058]
MKKVILALLTVIVLFVVVALVAGPLVVQSDFVKKIRAKNRDNRTKVLVEVLERGDLTRTINAPGTIEPESMVDISAQVSARIIALPFEEGDEVREGDVIVRLDDRDLAAALDAARARARAEEARLTGAEADLAEARAELTRQQGLYETKDVSLAALEAAEARYKRAESNLTQIFESIEIAKAQIRQAEKDLDNTVITSPIDGVVTALNADVGELVVIGTLNNPGSIIMQIADLSKILVRARVDESNVSLVSQGQDATVYLNAYPDKQFKGSVRFMKLQREIWRDGSGYVEAEVMLEDLNGERLYNGLTSNVDISVQTLEDVLKVPSQAVLDRRIEDLPDEVVRDNPQVDLAKTFTRVVYVYEEGKAIAKPVRIGSSDLTDTVVLAGLGEGEKVIVGPFSVLRELKHDQAVVDRAEVPDDEKEDGSDGEDAADEVQGDA